MGKKPWTQIDEDTTIVWIFTYSFDSSFTANLTLQKLIDSQSRGIIWVLFFNDLQQYVNTTLLQQFERASGLYKKVWIRRGRTFTVWTLLHRSVFADSTKKLVVVDNFVTIRASNYQNIYCWFKFLAATASTI